MKRSYAYILFPLAGMAFCLWYVCTATSDVVNSDYIRLVNSYLPDVWNPEKFFVADVLTRIPVNYLARILNVTFFDFSVRFDQILGILGLGLTGMAACAYARKEGLGFLTMTAVTLLIFSLNKWEMLTNGSGWAHFLTFAGFYYYYLVLDRVWKAEMVLGGQADRKDRIRLMVLPFIITLCIAGQYCAIYSGVLIAVYGFLALLPVLDRHFLKKETERPFWNRAVHSSGLPYIRYLLCILIPLALYMVSNAFTVEEHAGATDLTLMQAIQEKPKFFPAFFMKSFASMFLGGETMEQKFHFPNRLMLLIGLGVMAGYLLALWLNVKYRLYERTIFPLLLILSGGCSHVLILISRWIFLDQENYGMSSRYAVQFQMGIIGIVLTAALVWKLEGKKLRLKRRFSSMLAAAFCCVIVAGNLVTTADEIQKAPYRKDRYEEKVEAALHYEGVSDEDLERIFEYRKGPEKIRAALGILKDNHWNVYSRYDGEEQ